ncbi:4Fe-4S binding protein [bacterium]|nr:4Fe-4S binding protein [bacterium]
MNGDTTTSAPHCHAEIDAIVARIGRGPHCVIPVLQAIQERYHYLPEAALRRVAQVSEIRLADMMGVSTFYTQFRHEPAGRHTIKVCVGTACHVKGAERVTEAVRRYLGIPEGQDTDKAGLFTVTTVACLGCCTLAPAVQIDDVTYGHLAPGTVGAMVHDFLAEQERRKKGAAARASLPHGAQAGEIRIGQGSCCVAGGSYNVRVVLEDTVRESRVPVNIKMVGCVGMCHQTPLVEVVDKGGASTLYAKVTPKEARRIVSRHFKPRNPLSRLSHAVTAGLEKLLTDETWTPVERYSIDARDAPVCSFLGPQKHIAAEHCGQLDPLDLDDYISRDGYVALRNVLEAGDPAGVVEAITHSGLRGRGGAGFPTGSKWAAVRAAAGTRRFIVMNGDEGDPGAFMDRMLLESYPYRVLEGITIAAYAVGAHEGVLYIRAEYPLAVQRIRAAIAHLEERGLLGADVMGSGFPLALRVMEGAGAFVCGEETALLASIEGRRGMPRHRPPFPAEKGLFNTPTLINNVETYACVPWILRHGPRAFAALGTQASTGTKVFSLTGKVLRGGLIEVPMGVTIRQIVEEIGGGVAEGRTFKAVQIGGPSGGCIPERASDLPIDFEELTEAGAIMGSGGLVVLDDTDCMVDVSRYFLKFTQEQSCGKCTFCRIGTKRMLEVLDRFCEGTARMDDIGELEHLARVVKQGSLCGLGKTAPNPVLSTLRYFRDEYEAHVHGRCPAKKCKALIEYVITDDCIGCTKCAQRCPVDAIPMKPYERHVINTTICTQCDTCRQICPVQAVKIVDKGEGT